jgi:hypothetical protein
MRTTTKAQNLIQVEIKWRLVSGNVCYHSVQNRCWARRMSKSPRRRALKTYRAYGSVWVRNLVSLTKGGTQTESAGEEVTANNSLKMQEMAGC